MHPGAQVENRNPVPEPESPLSRLAHTVSLAGLVLYAIFAPHSVAAAQISVAIAVGGWLVRAAAIRRTGLHRTHFDLPILLFLAWTAASSFLSEEPRISLNKLKSSWVVLLFYLARALITRRTAVWLVSLLILSGVAGSLYSFYDLARGRGVVVTAIAPDSPFRHIELQQGDTIWRIAGHRVYSVAEIDGILRTTAPQASLVVGLISNGEQVERPGLTIDSETRKHNSPSGVIGAEHNHRFRASGWTRHYETFAESLQIIALLALGLALANLRNHGVNGRFRLAIVASIILALGIAVTAMRTVLLAFVVAAIFIVWRSLRKKAKLAFVIAILALLICGGLIVWKTRAPDALSLADPSSTLRGQVARVGLSRLMIHPIFGHGMDAMQAHWNEWGFPGHDMLHLHSTPLQLAFDRGLPALLLWLWIIGAFWFWTADAERASRDSSDTNRFGILLGSFGAVTGFFLSSLVNYNFGDAEVAMLFWWLMGIVVALTRQSD